MLEELLELFELHDAILYEEMIDPVVASDGYLYQRTAIAQIQRGNNKSPKTNEQLRRELFSDQLVSQLRELILDISEQHAKVLVDMLQGDAVALQGLPHSAKPRAQILRDLGLYCPETHKLLDQPYISVDGITRHSDYYDAIMFDPQYDNNNERLETYQQLEAFVATNCRLNGVDPNDAVIHDFHYQRKPFAHMGKVYIPITHNAAKKALAPLMQAAQGYYQNHSVKVVVDLISNLNDEQLQVFAGIIDSANQPQMKALKQAMRGGDLGKLHIALKKNPDFAALHDLTDDQGNNLFHLHCNQDRIIPFQFQLSLSKMLERLLQRVGSQAAELLQMQNEAGFTPIHYAVQFMSAEVLKNLLAKLTPEQMRRVLLMKVGESQQTALQIAMASREPEIIEIVVQALGDKAVEAAQQKNREEQNAVAIAQQLQAPGFAALFAEQVGLQLNAIDNHALQQDIRDTMQSVYDAFDSLATGSDDADAEQVSRNKLVADLRRLLNEYVHQQDFGRVESYKLLLQFRLKLGQQQTYGEAIIPSYLVESQFPANFSYAQKTQIKVVYNKLFRLPYLPLKQIDPILRENIIKLDLVLRYLQRHISFCARLGASMYVRSQTAVQKMTTKLSQHIDDFIAKQDFSTAAREQFAKDINDSVNSGLRTLVQHRGGHIALNVLVGMTGVGALIIAVHALVTYLKEGVARPLAKTKSAKSAEELKQIAKNIIKQERYQQVDIDHDYNVFHQKVIATMG